MVLNQWLMIQLNTSALVMELTHMSRFTTTTVPGGNRCWLWLRTLRTGLWIWTRWWYRSSRTKPSDLPTHIGGNQKNGSSKESHEEEASKEDLYKGYCPCISVQVDDHGSQDWDQANPPKEVQFTRRQCQASSTYTWGSAHVGSHVSAWVTLSFLYRTSFSKMSFPEDNLIECPVQDILDLDILSFVWYMLEWGSCCEERVCFNDSFPLLGLPHLVTYLSLQ